MNLLRLPAVPPRPQRPRITPREPLPGIPAPSPGQCGSCFGPIVRGDRIAFARGHAVHCRCVSEEDR